MDIGLKSISYRYDNSLLQFKSNVVNGLDDVKFYLDSGGSNSPVKNSMMTASDSYKIASQSASSGGKNTSDLLQTISSQFNDAEIYLDALSKSLIDTSEAKKILIKNDEDDDKKNKKNDRKEKEEEKGEKNNIFKAGSNNFDSPFGENQILEEENRDEKKQIGGKKFNEQIKKQVIKKGEEKVDKTVIKQTPEQVSDKPAPTTQPAKTIETVPLKDDAEITTDSAEKLELLKDAKQPKDADIAKDSTIKDKPENALGSANDVENTKNQIMEEIEQVKSTTQQLLNTLSDFYSDAVSGFENLKVFAEAREILTNLNFMKSMEKSYTATANAMGITKPENGDGNSDSGQGGYNASCESNAPLLLIA